MKDWNKFSTKVYRTLAEDSNCEPLLFLPINNKIKKAGLISSPGSGNTWTRHLIEQASGVYTGSVYEDKRLYKSGWKNVSNVFSLLSLALPKQQCNNKIHSF